MNGFGVWFTCSDYTLLYTIHVMHAEFESGLKKSNITLEFTERKLLDIFGVV